MRPATTLIRVGKLLQRAYGPRRPVRRRDNPLDWVLRALLSQGAASPSGERAYHALRLRFASYEDIHDAALGSLIGAIRCGGLATQTAVRIKALLEEIWVAQGHFDLSFLRDLSDDEVRAFLGRFKGIGSKTVSTVLLLGLGRAAFPVDTHVFRVVRRLGVLNGQRTPEAAQTFLEPRIPPEARYPMYLDLVEHGRQVCRAKQPLCQRCVLVRLCASARH